MVKLTGGSHPEPIDVGGASQAILCHSTSSPGKFHIAVKLEKPVFTKRFGEITYVCSCPGFMNHRKCWHVAWLNDEEEHDDG